MNDEVKQYDVGKQPVWCIYLCKCALPVIAIVKYQSEYKRGTILF